MRTWKAPHDPVTALAIVWENLVPRPVGGNDKGSTFLLYTQSCCLIHRPLESIENILLKMKITFRNKFSHPRGEKGILNFAMALGLVCS
jgi:hypothetical protein